MNKRTKFFKRNLHLCRHITPTIKLNEPDNKTRQKKRSIHLSLTYHCLARDAWCISHYIAANRFYISLKSQKGTPNCNSKTKFLKTQNSFIVDSISNDLNSWKQAHQLALDKITSCLLRVRLTWERENSQFTRYINFFA